MAKTISSAPPRLHAGQVQAWVGPAAYRRGLWYQRQGRVRAPRRHGWELRALCQGQAREPYRVRVRLGPHGVAQASCTCPAGREGRCKHVAAVLLHWVATPDAFPPVPSVAQRLASWDRAALVRLIEAMVDRDPELEALIAVYQPTSTATNPASSMDKAPDC